MADQFSPEDLKAQLARIMSAQPGVIEQDPLAGLSELPPEPQSEEHFGMPEMPSMSPGEAALKFIGSGVGHDMKSLFQPHTLAQGVMDGAMVARPELRLPLLAAQLYFNTGGSAGAGENADQIKDLQQKMRDAGVYGGDIDGIKGDETRHAIEEYGKYAERQKSLQIEADKAAAASKAGDAAIKESERKAKEAEQRAKEREAGEGRMRQMESDVPPWKKLLRDNSEVIGTIAGLGLGGYSRYKVAKSAEGASEKIAQRASKLMKDIPRDTPGRVGRINQFWSEGGAGKDIPFKPDPGSSSAFKANPAAPSASELYKPPGAFQGQLTARDATAMGIGGGEAAISGHFAGNAEDRLQKAREAVSADPSEANIRELNSATDEAAFFKGMTRVGLGAAAGYAGTSAKVGPKYAKPDLSVAEKQRINIDQSLAKPPKLPPQPPAKFVPGVPGKPRSTMTAKQLADSVTAEVDAWRQANPSRVMRGTHIQEIAKAKGIDISKSQAVTVKGVLQKAYEGKYINKGAKAAMESEE